MCGLDWGGRGCVAVAGGAAVSPRPGDRRHAAVGCGDRTSCRSPGANLADGSGSELVEEPMHVRQRRDGGPGISREVLTPDPVTEALPLELLEDARERQ